MKKLDNNGTIGIIGSKDIGKGIAILGLLNNYNVILFDNLKEVDDAFRKIEKDLEKITEKEKINYFLKNFKISTNFEELQNCDLIFEAIENEKNIDIKEVIKYKRSDKILVITSPLKNIGEIKEKEIIGIHFIDKPETSKLVEVFLINEKSENILKKVIEFLNNIKKDYIIIKKYIPGLLIDRVIALALFESIQMLQENYKIDEIDSMIRFRLGLPLGIFELSDYIGLDFIYNVSKEMINSGEKINIPNILENMIKENKTGVKSGEGFYKYHEKTFKKHTFVPRDIIYMINPARIVSVIVNEISMLIRNGIVTKEDVEKAFNIGLSWPHSPLSLADYYGLDYIINILNKRYNETKNEFYKPDQYLIDVSKDGLGFKSGKGFFNYNYFVEALNSVIYEQINDRAFITIRRPEKLNALNEDVWRNIRIFLEKAEKNPNVKSVILRGEGNAFSAGDDIEMMKEWNGFKAKKWLEELAWPLVFTIMNYTKPLIVAVRGYAFGGGMELTLLSDIVISTENSIFSIPEILIGAIPPMASPLGTYLTSRQIVRYALTGDWISSEEAKRLGIVDIIVPEDQLDIAIFEITDKLSKLSPLSLRAIKNSVNYSKSIFLSSLKNSFNELVLLANSNDFYEGMKAFLEKRKPNFKGD